MEASVGMIQPRRMTIAQFDAWVETADEGFTYELHDGVAYAFASGSASHGRLAMRLGSWISARLTPPCEVFLGSVSVRRHPERASSVVPDVLVTCEQPPPAQMYVTSPKLVVEIISPTSVVNDLNRKPRIYSAIPSIEEYLVVDSRSIWARVFRREPGGELPSEGEGVSRVDAVVEVSSVGVSFTLSELYDGILDA